MSDDLEISGGAGGLGATYDDMLTFAGVLDATADGLRGTTEDLVRLGGSRAGELAEASLLVPDKVVAAEAEHVGAIAATGLLMTEMEVSARLVRASVWAYETTDAALAGMQEDLYGAGGFALGMGAIPLALTGSAALLVAASRNPALAAELQRQLATPEGRAALAADLNQTLYEHPWLQEALTRSAPGLVQGLATSVLGFPGALALSGGQWPTGDYHDSVSGLLAAAGTAGLLQDTGSYRVRPGGEQSALPPGSFSEDQFLGDVFREQGLLSESSRQQTHVQVVQVPQPDGSAAWVVQVPGTQEMAALEHGENLSDMVSNVHGIESNGTGPPTLLEEQVLAAMREAGIGRDDPVMMTGHSQGGIVAASLAARQPEDFHITSVVTGGSPIGRFEMPDSVSVMSLEHEQDIIPRLDGSDNSDAPNWVTVRRDLSGDSAPALSAAHDTEQYRATGGLVDDSDSGSAAAWRERNAAFFAGSAPVTAEQYTIERRP